MPSQHSELLAKSRERAHASAGAAAHVTREEVLAPGRKWTWTLVSGIFTIFLALAAFLLPLVEWMPKGGLVGWLLLLAGIAELIFGRKRDLGVPARAAIGSGFLTALAGLFFIANPLAGYLSVATIVMAWLILRGGWMLAVALLARRKDEVAAWLTLSGAADMILGFALVIGVQVTALVVTLFGPTPEIVARFALILAASFLMTGVSQVGIARIQRRSLDLAAT